MPRYYVGIDLGTTNSVVYFIDTALEEAEPQIFKIPQITDFGEITEKDTLPSFLYLPDNKEVPEDGLALPWDSDADFSVGEFAKKNASKMPNKVISSSKSWLCAGNVDRLSPILPWNRNQPEKQLSPVEATKRILEHIKNSWNSIKAEDSVEDILENQAVILTVPASFDAVARELTVKAAVQAGLKTVLLEEPQAAFYSWLTGAQDNWRDKVTADDVVLVCDIGGGTTDFSLIKVIDNEGELGLERIAVGNHILLGGDNMDLTMAYNAAAKFKSANNLTLDAYQIAGLTHACRQAKETLMSNPDADAQKLTVLGRGSSLIGGTISTELTRKELTEILLDGFFPVCDLTDKPKAAKKSGLRTFGLNYEFDPAITKHLAAFLSKHCEEGTLPSCILFNGGVSKADAIRERVIKTIKNWLPKDAKELNVLTGNNPDLAVAFGAGCYARVREGDGIRIKAGSSHAYYLGIESSMPAVPGFVPPIQGLCVLPMGTEEGTGTDIDYKGLGLLVGETTEFHFFSSTTKYDDIHGTIIVDTDEDSDLEQMPSLSATLPAAKDVPPGSLIPIKLRSELTETGTMQIWCFDESSDSKWKLDFELRSNTETE